MYTRPHSRGQCTVVYRTTNTCVIIVYNPRVYIILYILWLYMIHNNCDCVIRIVPLRCTMIHSFSSWSKPAKFQAQPLSHMRAPLKYTCLGYVIFALGVKRTMTDDEIGTRILHYLYREMYKDKYRVCRANYVQNNCIFRTNMHYMPFFLSRYFFPCALHRGLKDRDIDLACFAYL